VGIATPERISLLSQKEALPNAVVRVVQQYEAAIARYAIILTTLSNSGNTLDEVTQRRRARLGYNQKNTKISRSSTSERAALKACKGAASYALQSLMRIKGTSPAHRQEIQLLINEFSNIIRDYSTKIDNLQ